MIRAYYVCVTVLLFATFQLLGQRLPPVEEELLQRAIVPFNTPDDAPLLRALINLVGSKSIVAVGEVTHGTEQIEKLQLQIAQSLVRDQAFNAVALGEIYISSTWALNEYVLFGTGSAEQALGMAFQYQYGGVSVEMLRFVELLRVVNASRPLNQRVWLIGTEVGPPSQLARIVWTYCQTQRVELPDSLQKTLAELMALPVEHEARSDVDRLLTAARALTALLFRDDTAASFTLKQHWQRQCIRQLTQSLETFCRPTQAHRDRGIYENIHWLKQRRPDAKVVVIAVHNVHIEKRPCYHWEGLARAGYWLDSTYRKQFVAIGTEVGRGTYASGNEKETRVVQVPENRRKLGTLISRVTSSPYGFIRLNESPDVAQFFKSHNRLTYGTSYQRVGMTWPCAALPDAFDALLYSRESTPNQRSVVADDSSAAPAFSLYVNMADSLKRQLQRAGHFRVSVRTDFTAIKDADCFVRLTVYFHNKQMKQLQYHVIPLSSGLLVDQLFRVPSQAHFISVSLYADQAAILALKRFDLDNRPLPSSIFSFHDWELTNIGKDGTYRATYLPWQVVVQRQ